MKETLSAIFTAVVASLCCVGPFVLVTLGVSGAWIGSLRVFEPYRPLFILLTIGFLAFGFYRVYRKPKEDCPCAASQAKRAGRVALWVVTMIVLFLLILPYLIGLLA